VRSGAVSMLEPEIIDTMLDFRNETPKGKDPDSHSPTLREYHKRLWSKPLPNGKLFTLRDGAPGAYLHHRSDLGEFWLASDAVVPSFTRAKEIQHVIEQIPSKELSRFNSVGYTMGGMMIWPAQRVDKKMTINQQRGCHPRIRDRFDLTVECVKRHYEGLDSPLAETLSRYGEFFSLFGSFKGFVEFFLLQDIVSNDDKSVRRFGPFNGFNASPLPQNPREYREYMEDAIQFIEARNRRIDRYWEVHGI